MLEFFTDFDAISEISGTLEGLEKLTQKDGRYMEMLLREAHEETSKKFDLAAVASAPAIPHMFEFGTAGVTAGPPRFSPMDPNSHLWRHEINTSGGNADISFMFKPAKVFNPKPTEKSTGVSRKYLQFLSNRKYLFWNKAFVMETGQQVKINAVNGDFLFVPFYGNPSYGKYMNNRGYMMWNSKALGPIRTVPGAEVRGNFGMIWDGWWSAEGRSLMERDVTTSYENDFRVAMEAAAARSASVAPKPVLSQVTRSKTVKAKAAKSTIGTMLSRAAGRLGRRR